MQTWNEKYSSDSQYIMQFIYKYAYSLPKKRLQIYIFMKYFQVHATTESVQLLKNGVMFDTSFIKAISSVF